MKYIVLFILSVIVPFTTANAEEVKRDVTITKIAPFAKSRPANAPSQGFTRVYVNDGAWGNTNCRTDAADISNEDSHILSALLAGWMAKKKIAIHVETSMKPLDTACQVTWITVQ